MKALDEATDIVKRRWGGVGIGWKVGLVISLVGAGILGFVSLCIWSFGKLVQGLTIGGFRNQSLYLPRMRRRRL